VDIIIIERARLFLGLGLDHGGVGPHFHLASVVLTRQAVIALDVGDMGRHVVAAQIGEDEIAMLAGEMPAALRGAGIHDRRIGMLDRLRLKVAALDLVESAFLI
jgi:hypothetical protein